ILVFFLFSLRGSPVFSPFYSSAASDWYKRQSYPVHQKQKLIDADLKLMATAKMPDALRLSGLRHLCNILNLRAFVGRIRRSRRIRHE
ncbi:hypothetical protein, partial [Escherichia coli]|uniref:hypothetical protein n=1 Tax=Escherichia coli TaxID=562 RepID=UPI00259CBAF8